MLRSIQEEPEVTAALQRARAVYPRVWEAFEALCWVLARREDLGARVAGESGVYYLYKQTANVWGVPTLTVIYTVSDGVVCLRTVRVG